MSGFDDNSDSNFTSVFHKELRLECMLSTKISYIYKS